MSIGAVSKGDAMAAELQLFHDLDSAAATAGAELSRDARPSLFDRLDWFRLVDRHRQEGRPLVLHARNAVALAWLFLCVDGASAEALVNWYSVRFGPIVEGTPGAAPFEALVAGVRRAGITRLFLKPMDEPHSLSRALRRRGWATAISSISATWRIPTRGMSFDDYWAGRPGRLRSGVDRRLKQGKLQCVVHDRFDAQAWQDYETVYGQSWKPAEGSPDFLRRLAEQEGEAGTLRLGIAYHQEQPVAAQFWLVENGVATAHKSAYREDAARLAAGNILRVAMIRRALDVDHVDIVDFGIGDHSYKADWVSERVPLYALTAYDLLRPRGFMGAVRAAIGKLVRRDRSA